MALHGPLAVVLRVARPHRRLPVQAPRAVVQLLRRRVGRRMGRLPVAPRVRRLMRIPVVAVLPAVLVPVAVLAPVAVQLAMLPWHPRPTAC
ncbi:MAG: hypothetical protein JWN15_1992 [Firmicutes bacterium]|nr:hypothetical protein [Bacillota bacterium]